MDLLAGQLRASSLQLACGDHTYRLAFCHPSPACDFLRSTADNVRSPLARPSWYGRAGDFIESGSAFCFFVSNIAHWLGSNVVRQWLWVMAVGTFGTILLRPYYLVVGLPTTLVAWLMNRNDLLWAPRFSSTEALLWCITLVGFASIAPAVTLETRRTRAIMLAAAVVIAAVSASAQLALVPQARSAYLLRSGSPYSPLERQQADEMFARYRREGKPGEPVIASTMLFRYAHDRNLFWLDRLHGRPPPIWILGDSADNYVPFRISADTIDANSGIRMEDYKVIDRRGRFVLLRKKDYRKVN